MKIIFSRKGFDSGAGRAPSPIVDGRAQSLPIPVSSHSATSYQDLGLGNLVERMTRRKITADQLCHNDPMFAENYCWFGQCDAAQGHLARQGVGVGDVFLFFGLFACPSSGQSHHRFFGFMKVAGFGSPAEAELSPAWRKPPTQHPHTIDDWPKNNTIWFGSGRTNAKASSELRLTVEEGPTSLWNVEPWLQNHGLTYHGRADRWLKGDRLQSVARGQEFVCEIGAAELPNQWLERIIAEISR